jgi:ankyrin repeat protein
MNPEEKQLLLALIDDNPAVVTTILDLTNSVNIQLSLHSIEIPALLGHSPPLISVAVFLNAINCISALLVHRSNLTITDSLGRTPLHFAAAFGNLDILELLTQAGACLTVTDSKERNILHYAAKFGHRHVIQWITAKGIELSGIDRNGFNALHFAAESGDDSVITQLLFMSCPQVKSVGGWTPLLFTAKHNHIQAFRILLSHGGDIGAANEVRLGLSARCSFVCSEVSLHWACFNGNLAMAKLCLRNGNDVNVVTKKNETPLMFAVMNGHKEIADFLMASGADPAICGVRLGVREFVDIGRMFVWGFFGLIVGYWNALHLAANRGDADIVSALVETQMDLNMKDHDAVPMLVIALHYILRLLVIIGKSSVH